jgi:hypothetical protein
MLAVGELQVAAAVQRHRQEETGSELGHAFRLRTNGTVPLDVLDRNALNSNGRLSSQSQSSSPLPPESDHLVWRVPQRGHLL